jgi:hypothetical protein
MEMAASLANLFTGIRVITTYSEIPQAHVFATAFAQEKDLLLCPGEAAVIL